MDKGLQREGDYCNGDAFSDHKTECLKIYFLKKERFSFAQGSQG